MEYIRLGDLAKQHNTSGITETELLALFEQTLKALEYLHGRPICHRDVKPANLLVRSRVPFHIKLTDFGLATEGF